tara:strand:- start:253 stop:588 length:336 start_codon:yes stop_codon:yes gene_type:complete
MNTVMFLDSTWQEIPELDNPAMRCNMIKDSNNFGALIHPECIMIFKGDRSAYRITDGGFVVAQVPKEGDIIKLGVFWSSKNAELFADTFSDTGSDELSNGTKPSLEKRPAR